MPRFSIDASSSFSFFFFSGEVVDDHCAVQFFEITDVIESGADFERCEREEVSLGRAAELHHSPPGVLDGFPDRFAFVAHQLLDRGTWPVRLWYELQVVVWGEVWKL